jgi:hypothetical protein
LAAPKSFFPIANPIPSAVPSAMQSMPAPQTAASTVPVPSAPAVSVPPAPTLPTIPPAPAMPVPPAPAMPVPPEPTMLVPPEPAMLAPLVLPASLSPHPPRFLPLAPADPFLPAPTPTSPFEAPVGPSKIKAKSSGGKSSSAPSKKSLEEKFTDAVDAMCELQLGNDWSLSLNLLSQIESSLMFGASDSKSRTLTNSNRPDEIRTWIGAHRNMSRPPKILDVPAYGEKCLKWWRSLQPAWRQKEGGKLPSAKYNLPPGADWGILLMPGPNGLLSVLITFSFWGTQPGVLASEIWRSLTADLRRTLQALAAFAGSNESGQEGGNSGGEEEDAGASVGSKRTRSSTRKLVPRKRTRASNV